MYIQKVYKIRKVWLGFYFLYSKHLTYFLFRMNFRQPPMGGGGYGQGMPPTDHGMQYQQNNDRFRMQNNNFRRERGRSPGILNKIIGWDYYFASFLHKTN